MNIYDILLQNFKYSGEKITCKYAVEPLLVRGYFTIPDVTGTMNMDLYADAETLDELKAKVAKVIEGEVSVPYEIEYVDITEVKYWRSLGFVSVLKRQSDNDLQSLELAINHFCYQNGIDSSTIQIRIEGTDVVVGVDPAKVSDEQIKMIEGYLKEMVEAAHPD